jgi:hypothetical protein
MMRSARRFPRESVPDSPPFIACSFREPPARIPPGPERGGFHRKTNQVDRTLGSAGGYTLGDLVQLANCRERGRRASDV